MLGFYFYAANAEAGSTSSGDWPYTLFGGAAIGGAIGAMISEARR